MVNRAHAVVLTAIEEDPDTCEDLHSLNMLLLQYIVVMSLVAYWPNIFELAPSEPNVPNLLPSPTMPCNFVVHMAPLIWSGIPFHKMFMYNLQMCSPAKKNFRLTECSPRFEHLIINAN